MTKKLNQKLPKLPQSANSATLDSGLLDRVVGILEGARGRALRQVNSEMVLAYWLIGREIVEALQGGEARADYGAAVLEALSQGLQTRYGRGFSVSNIQYFRQFYLTYSHRKPEIRHEPRGKSLNESSSTVISDLTAAVVEHDALQGFSAHLSWTHYRSLCRIESQGERLFYEVEAERNAWSQPELERQMHSHLYLRLWKSRDKAGLMSLAKEGQLIEKPLDAIKHPYVLDFLGLPEATQWHEADLEAAIINQLQPFLLELGKGFAFVARQLRIGTEHQHFYIDLVFYNYLLKCFVLVDLKMGKLSHQDVGQMDMYVRLFDDLKRSEGDNPTVGLILCAERDEVVARYSVLNEGKQLFASRYQMVLPSEETLRAEIVRETERLHQTATQKSRDK
jgi:predicted nuclease of restriction endonuclease-like (RecB) superfamily